MWKGCENVSNDGHSQYWEWPSMVKFSQPFQSVNGLLIKGSYFSFSFILPKNEAVTIFWLYWHSTIQFGLEQLYGFCDEKKQIKINLNCRLSKPILKTLCFAIPPYW